MAFICFNLLFAGESPALRLFRLSQQSDPALRDIHEQAMGGNIWKDAGLSSGISPLRSLRKTPVK
jgi:hypothetical protein